MSAFLKKNMHWIQVVEAIIVVGSICMAFGKFSQKIEDYNNIFLYKIDHAQSKVNEIGSDLKDVQQRVSKIEGQLIERK